MQRDQSSTSYLQYSGAINLYYPTICLKLQKSVDNQNWIFPQSYVKCNVNRSRALCQFYIAEGCKSLLALLKFITGSQMVQQSKSSPDCKTQDVTLLFSIRVLTFSSADSTPGTCSQNSPFGVFVSFYLYNHDKLPISTE